MKKILLIFSLLLAACGSDPAPEQLETPLPLKNNKWVSMGLEESRNTETFVLELTHGWLVYHESGFGGGMAFVPRPSESEE
jgi:hypothetical protein